MNEKRKCKKCGLLIDSDLPSCPYCGYKNEEVIEAEVVNEEKKGDEKIEKKKHQRELFDYKKQVIQMSSKYMNLLMFLFGWIGISIISTCLSIVLMNNNFYVTYFSIYGSALLNFACYLILFGGFLLLISGDAFKFLDYFKNYRTYIYGLCYGLVLIAVSSIVSNLMYLIFGNTSVNNNESSIDSIVAIMPISSIIIFGLVGPFCEELTYRVGLFSVLHKKSRYLAYIVTALLFGFLHFDFSSLTDGNALKVEFINLPNYIVSGALLCYFYEKEGIGASFIAHATNNLLSIIITIIL